MAEMPDASAEERAPTLDLGAVPVDDGFFLLRRRSTPAPFVPERREGRPEAPFRHCFTYLGSDSTIRQELETMIANARRKVFVASFLMGDPVLVELLAEAAERLVGGIYVITSLDEASLRRGLAELNEGMQDRDEDPVSLQIMRKRFDALTTRGIYVRGHPNFHAKFVVVDDETALVSSANLMTRALDVTGEDGVVVTDPIEVDRLARLFTRMWHDGPHEAVPGETYALKSRRNRRPWPGHVPPPAISPTPQIVWTAGEQETHLLETIRDIIRHAADDLVLGTFSLEGLRARREVILHDIEAACRRGVRVRVLVRPRVHLEGHMGDAGALVDAGAVVLGDRLNHAKCAIADRRHGALFSANLDTRHGLTNGVEVGCRLDGTPALAEAIEYFEHALDQAELVYRRRPTATELDQGLDGPWRLPWKLGRRITVRATPDHRRRFTSAAAAGPVLFTHSNAGTVELQAGNQGWLLDDTGAAGNYTIQRRPRPFTPQATTLEALRLRQAAGKRDDTKLGVCPAVIEWRSHD